jgi:hypothetical protein
MFEFENGQGVCIYKIHFETLALEYETTNSNLRCNVVSDKCRS